MEGSYAWMEGMRDDFSPPPDCDGRCRDMFMEFIYIVVVPGGVTLLAAIICGICICCSRVKRKPSDDEIELDKYNTIRRASQSLRDLSHKRDTLLLSSRSGSLSYSDSERFRRGIRGGRDTSYSAPSTLQRDRRRVREPRSASPASYHHVPNERNSSPPPYQRVPSDQYIIHSPGNNLMPPPSNNSLIVPD